MVAPMQPLQPKFEGTTPSRRLKPIINTMQETVSTKPQAIVNTIQETVSAKPQPIEIVVANEEQTRNASFQSLSSDELREARLYSKELVAKKIDSVLNTKEFTLPSITTLSKVQQAGYMEYLSYLYPEMSDFSLPLPDEFEDSPPSSSNRQTNTGGKRKTTHRKKRRYHDPTTRRK